MAMFGIDWELEKYVARNLLQLISVELILATRITKNIYFVR